MILYVIKNKKAYLKRNKQIILIKIKNLRSQSPNRSSVIEI